jgi:serine/threonine protein kinase
MDHPNIIAYYDSFEKDGILMIEMEYADGGNLADFLAKQTRFILIFLILIHSRMTQALSNF